METVQLELFKEAIPFKASKVSQESTNKFFLATEGNKENIKVTALNGTEKQESPTVEFISFETKKASKAEAESLNIPTGSNIYKIYNKLGLNKKFYIVDKIIISQDKFPGLNEEIFKNRANTIYNLYQNKFNIFITNCSEKLKAITSNEKISKLLNIELGSPILKIDRIGQTYHNETIEIRTSYVHTSDIEYIHSQNSTFGESL